MTSSRTTTAALRTVALFEGAKGLLALAAAAGLPLLLHRDLYDIAERLVRHLHLNPASHYPQVFLDFAQHLSDMHLGLLSLGVVVYATVRLLEAYGLFHGRAWAEWLSALSGAIYVPFEVRGLLRHPNLWHASVLLVNLAVVAIMVMALRARKRQEAAAALPG